MLNTAATGTDLSHKGVKGQQSYWAGWRWPWAQEHPLQRKREARWRGREGLRANTNIKERQEGGGSKVNVERGSKTRWWAKQERRGKPWETTFNSDIHVLSQHIMSLCGIWTNPFFEEETHSFGFAAHVAVPCLPLPGTRGGLTSRLEAALPVYEASPLHHSKKKKKKCRSLNCHFVFKSTYQFHRRSQSSRPESDVIYSVCVC